MSAAELTLQSAAMVATCQQPDGRCREKTRKKLTKNQPKISPKCKRILNCHLLRMTSAHVNNE